MPSLSGCNSLSPQIRSYTQTWLVGQDGQSMSPTLQFLNCFFLHTTISLTTIFQATCGLSALQQNITYLLPSHSLKLQIPCSALFGRFQNQSGSVFGQVMVLEHLCPKGIPSLPLHSLSPPPPPPPPLPTCTHSEDYYNNSLQRGIITHLTTYSTPQKIVICQ